MMEWQDEGIILHKKDFGENKQIISLFTASHGRCSGVLRVSQKNKSWIQCGGKVKARWSARLETHLGLWSYEPLPSPFSLLLEAPGPLSALISTTALCHLVLPERHTYPQLYQRLERLISNLASSTWATSYTLFELALLEELGYGLDLQSCAVTGVTTDLTAISPRTGRAVCQEIASSYEGRLLPLPSFILENQEKIQPSPQEILDALHLSGYFLERFLLGKSLPAARERLVQWVRKERKFL